MRKTFTNLQESLLLEFYVFCTAHYDRAYQASRYRIMNIWLPWWMILVGAYNIKFSPCRTTAHKWNSSCHPLPFPSRLDFASLGYVLLSVDYCLQHWHPKRKMVKKEMLKMTLTFDTSSNMNSRKFSEREGPWKMRNISAFFSLLQCFILHSSVLDLTIRFSKHLEFSFSNLQFQLNYSKIWMIAYQEARWMRHKWPQYSSSLILGHYSPIWVPWKFSILVHLALEAASPA